MLNETSSNKNVLFVVQFYNLFLKPFYPMSVIFSNATLSPNKKDQVPCISLNLPFVLTLTLVLVGEVLMNLSRDHWFDAAQIEFLYG